MRNSIMIFIFLILDRKYSFWINWSQMIKSVANLCLTCLTLLCSVFVLTNKLKFLQLCIFSTSTLQNSLLITNDIWCYLSNLPAVCLQAPLSGCFYILCSLWVRNSKSSFFQHFNLSTSYDSKCDNTIEASYETYYVT